MADDSSSEDEDFGAALAKATAAKAASRAATKKKSNIVVPVPAPETDEESDEGDEGCVGIADKPPSKQTSNILIAGLRPQPPLSRPVFRHSRIRLQRRCPRRDQFRRQPRP